MVRGRVRMQDPDVTATAACTGSEWTREGMRSTAGPGCFSTTGDHHALLQVPSPCSGM
jgi:hypothetical protein